jgi:transposase
MKSYSEDLRKKIVDAVEQRGVGQSQAARAFDVSLSSVKRYLGKSRQGRSLSPGKALGKRPKMGELAGKLLEEDLKERPFVTLTVLCWEEIYGLKSLEIGWCDPDKSAQTRT